MPRGALLYSLVQADPSLVASNLADPPHSSYGEAFLSPPIVQWHTASATPAAQPLVSFSAVSSGHSPFAEPWSPESDTVRGLFLLPPTSDARVWLAGIPGSSARPLQADSRRTPLSAAMADDTDVAHRALISSPRPPNFLAAESQQPLSPLTHGHNKHVFVVCTVGQPW